MAQEFQGKTALVTGASRGIGAATAIALATAGCARVLLHYASGIEGARATAKAVESAGAQAVLLHGELSHEDGIAAFVESLQPYIPTIDFLINNAGSLLKRAKLADMDLPTYNQVMDLNAKSVWFITQAVAPGMIARGSGVIVNLSSIAARNGGGLGATIYSAAKAAVAAMTKGLAKELAPAGIRVNALSPGTVDNDFHARFSTREILDGVVKMTPQGRLSTNEDMAEVIVFLCSNAARNVVGQTIEVNGGAFMV
ncbi:SDR family oxidoreductase [uncultured Paludibaculum sp.]|uniref:SDR family NAD(P)-dependent oxidoreductase n=1 Tax=uncultured Paludibaculum sp. TaxID=1765020 RepID=UPI002AABFDD0|nr:SDR family oxidoreductase [uncultured Paludibaculum sp.]